MWSLWEKRRGQNPHRLGKKNRTACSQPIKWFADNIFVLSQGQFAHYRTLPFMCSMSFLACLVRRPGKLLEFFQLLYRCLIISLGLLKLMDVSSPFVTVPDFFSSRHRAGREIAQACTVWIRAMISALFVLSHTFPHSYLIFPNNLLK